jgi:hypothetical protein
MPVAPRYIVGDAQKRKIRSSFRRSLGEGGLKDSVVLKIIRELRPEFPGVE